MSNLLANYERVVEYGHFKLLLKKTFNWKCYTICRIILVTLENTVCAVKKSMAVIYVLFAINLSLNIRNDSVAVSSKIQC